MKSRIGLMIGFLLVLLWLFRGGVSPEDKAQNEKGVVLSAPEARGNRSPNLKRATIIPIQPDLRSVLAVQTEAEDSDQDVVTYRYRWTVNRKWVSENATLPLERFKQEDVVSVEVIPFDGKVEGTSVHASPVHIGNKPPTVSRIVFEPENPKAGEAIRAIVEGSDADGDSIFYSYQWTINGQAIKGRDADRLGAGIVRSNDTITVIVTPNDSYSDGPPKTSRLMAIKNNPPKIVSVPPSAIKEGEFVYQIASEDPDGDSLEYYLLEGPSGMALDPGSGRLAWQVASPPEGKAEVAIGVNDGKGGKSEQRFTIRTTQ